MRYAGIIKNDIAAAPGISVSFFVQGCPIHCPGCHNPQTWDFNGGKEFTPSTLDMILDALTANNIKRNLCIMGGEPLCEQNEFLTYLVIKTVKEKLPDTKIYIYTGYYYSMLLEHPTAHLDQILDLTDVLVDGPFIQEQRDITLFMRGSSNQHIMDLTCIRNKNML